MGNRNRRIYYESVISGKPLPWVAPPARIIAGDVVETVGNAALALGGTWLIFGGIQYFITRGIDINDCAAAGGIAAGTVLIMPVVSDILSDVISDARTAWERGAALIAEPEPEAESAPLIEPIEDEAGAARVPGAWWYRTRGGQLRCYYTPTSPKDRRPIISDQRMQAIFRLALNGTAFSEDAIRAQVKVSQPRFRILQRDWRKKVLYILNEDNSGYLTKDGRIVAEAIVNTPLPQSR